VLTHLGITIETCSNDSCKEGVCVLVAVATTQMSTCKLLIHYPGLDWDALGRQGKGGWEKGAGGLEST